MSLNKTLEDYILAQDKYKKAKHELNEAETILEMECRKMSNYSDKIIDVALKKLATILLGKLR